MTFNNDERDKIRRGMTIIVEEAPPAPDFEVLPTVQLERPTRSAPLNRWVVFGLAFVGSLVAVGAIVALKGDGQILIPADGSIPPTAPAEFPRLLIEDSAWVVVRYDEQRGPMEDGSGEYHFAETDFVSPAGDAELRMNQGDADDLAGLIADRENSGARLDDASVLDATAAVVRYDRTVDDFAAMWLLDGIVYEVRAQVDEGTLRAVLDSLQFVHPETWKAALPDSAITDREAAVREMVTGLPLTDGFEIEALFDGDVQDRYQLGARVAGSVACSWFDQWNKAVASGDEERRLESLAALEASREWPVLLQMDVSGDYPEAIWEYVDVAAAGGTIEGRPLAQHLDPGLGCADFGIPITPEDER